MSLNIYTSEDKIPSDIALVTVNDIFFTKTNIIDSAVSREILDVIDNAQYVDGDNFISRINPKVAYPKDCLSTGTKTLLNILSYPDMCFDVSECGLNAEEFLPKLKDGNILWKYPVLIEADTYPIDVNLNGVHYSDLFDMLDAASERDYLDDEDE